VVVSVGYGGGRGGRHIHAHTHKYIYTQQTHLEDPLALVGPEPQEGQGLPIVLGARQRQALV
jgi:hypothetical protein